MIDIGTVLMKFDDTYDEGSLQVKSYWIRFITQDGRIRTMHARKNVKSPKQKLRAPLRARGKGLFHLQRHGTMLVQDLEAGEPRTVKVAQIYQFRDNHSTTWLNVRH